MHGMGKILESNMNRYYRFALLIVLFQNRMKKYSKLTELGKIIDLSEWYLEQPSMQHVF